MAKPSKRHDYKPWAPAERLPFEYTRKARKQAKRIAEQGLLQPVPPPVPEPPRRDLAVNIQAWGDSMRATIEDANRFRTHLTQVVAQGMGIPESFRTPSPPSPSSPSSPTRMPLVRAARLREAEAARCDQYIQQDVSFSQEQIRRVVECLRNALASAPQTPWPETMPTTNSEHPPLGPGQITGRSRGGALAENVIQSQAAQMMIEGARMGLVGEAQVLGRLNSRSQPIIGFAEMAAQAGEVVPVRILRGDVVVNRPLLDTDVVTVYVLRRETNATPMASDVRLTQFTWGRLKTQAPILGMSVVRPPNQTGVVPWGRGTLGTPSGTRGTITHWRALGQGNESFTVEVRWDDGVLEPGIPFQWDVRYCSILRTDDPDLKIPAVLDDYVTRADAGWVKVVPLDLAYDIQVGSVSRFKQLAKSGMGIVLQVRIEECPRISKTEPREWAIEATVRWPDGRCTSHRVKPEPVTRDIMTQKPQRPVSGNSSHLERLAYAQNRLAEVPYDQEQLTTAAAELTRLLPTLTCGFGQVTSTAGRVSSPVLVKQALLAMVALGYLKLETPRQNDKPVSTNRKLIR